MIMVDYRIGSKQLTPELLRLGLQVEEVELEYGDVAFEAYGPEGEYLVGVERKTLSDLLTCMTDSRYSAHQLPGMLRSYQENYLLLEGAFRRGPNGSIQVYIGQWVETNRNPRRITYDQFDKFLWTVRRQAGVHVFRCRSIEDSAHHIRNLYDHCRKRWEDHKSFHRFAHNGSIVDTLINKPSLVRRIAKEFDGLGWIKSKGIADNFNIPQQFANATVEQLKAAGLGPALANRVYKAWRERCK